jgi:hypothetical protein
VTQFLKDQIEYLFNIYQVNAMPAAQLAAAAAARFHYEGQTGVLHRQRSSYGHLQVGIEGIRG